MCGWCRSRGSRPTKYSRNAARAEGRSAGHLPGQGHSGHSGAAAPRWGRQGSGRPRAGVARRVLHVNFRRFPLTRRAGQCMMIDEKPVLQSKYPHHFSRRLTSGSQEGKEEGAQESQEGSQEESPCQEEKVASVDQRQERSRNGEGRHGLPSPFLRFERMAWRAPRAGVRLPRSSASAGGSPLRQERGRWRSIRPRLGQARLEGAFPCRNYFLPAPTVASRRDGAPRGGGAKENGAVRTQGGSGHV